MAALPRSATLARSLPPVYAAAALRLALPLVILPLMASRLGADAFGRLGFILAWAGLLAVVVEGGFLAAATRLAVVADAAQRHRLAQQVFTARCVLCAVAVALAFAVARWAAPAEGTQPAHGLVDAVAIAALACALGWPATWYLQATQQLARWAQVEMAVVAALLIACWAVADSVAVYVALQWLAAVVLAVWGWRWLRADLAGHAAGSSAASLWAPPQLRAGLRLGWTMMPVAIAGAAYSAALPAVASGQLPAAELGLYFMADRLVRALLAAADPVYAVVYPRIVERFGARTAEGERRALRYAGRWAAAGLLGGAVLWGLGAALWTLVVAMPMPRLGGLDPARLHAVLQVLGCLLPLLMGWKFIGYWMLGSGRYDHAYRLCVIAGGAVGVAGAWGWAGARTAAGLAWVALAAEATVIAVAVAGVMLTRAAHRA